MYLPKYFLSVSLVINLVASYEYRAIAQITPDQTLGTENSVVKLNTNLQELPAQVIDGGATRGINLFHSFAEFNVNANSQVYFHNPTGIENILSRVTGSQSSQILGTLGVLGNANLFLINPNGILFGENATLDIRGSFLATTADGIKLGETGLFNAADPQNSNLLSVQPGTLFANALSQYQATITNQGNLTTGKNLTLAADNLDLQGKLKAGTDLQLIATNNLTIRDSQLKPFITTSGGNQLIQGNQLVDIFALNHPDSGLFAGNNMILRSDNTIQGDAHYWSGGNFEIQKLDHGPGNLSSPLDPIILATGDVKLANYTGASLHILAGGSVTANDIRINAIDTTQNTINPLNSNSFLAKLASFNLSDGTPIIIDGNKNQTLDIRAGIDWGLIPGFPGNTNPSSLNQTPNANATSATIKINEIRSVNPSSSTVNTSANRSFIFLSNQYKSHQFTSADNNISIGTILAGTNNAQNPGSLVIIDSRGDINLNGRINTSASGTTLQNNGGNITFLADGKINLLPLPTPIGNQNGSFIVSNGLKGGDILLRAKGDITFTTDAYINSNNSLVNGLVGGNITLDSQANIILMGQSGASGDTIVTETRSALNNAIGGNITIKAKSLTADNNTKLITRALGAATGGDIFIDITDNVNLNNSSVVSDTTNATTGNAGNIKIQAASIFLNNKSTLDTRNLGSGIGGNINLKANDLLQFDNKSAALSTVEVTGKGIGGDIKIEVPNGTLMMTNQSQLESQTKGDGNAGHIIINAKTIDINANSSISVSTSSNGNAGTILIENVNDFRLNNDSSIFASTLNPTQTGAGGDIIFMKVEKLDIVNSKISARTASKGNAGKILIENVNYLSLNNSLVSTETAKAGLAGNIDINTNALKIFNNSRFSATATNTATNKGGNISINANEIQINGQESGLFAETQGQGAAGSLNITTSKLIISEGARVSATATNTATKNAGDININANEVGIKGEKSGLFAETQGQGAAGSLNITISKLTIDDGAKISAANIDGEGGSININGNTLTVSNGGQILTTTSGQAKAGNINLQVLENITLSDPNSGIFANTNPGSIGDSGNIVIDPQIFMIKDGAGIGVNSKGSGKGGNIDLQAGTLTLDNNAFITAATASNQGGEINLQVQDLLWLRHGSNITATAGTAGAAGNGGNINIKTPFILGFANENSNITANAFEGNGGNINIKTNAILGLKFSNQETPLSDITASSQFGLSGNVQINTPEVDPTAGLVELPINLVDAGSLIGKNICEVENDRVAKGNSFVITGKGGLPANTDDLIPNSSGIVEWVDNSSQQIITPVVMRQRKNSNQEKTSITNSIIQQAQGWIITNDGKIILTATATNVTPHSSGLNHPSCHN